MRYCELEPGDVLFDGYQSGSIGPWFYMLIDNRSQVVWLNCFTGEVTQTWSGSFTVEDRWELLRERDA